MKIFNYDIDFKSFLRKGVPPKDEPFGNFLINGVMGSGKSYFAVLLAYKLPNKYTIKTNIKSLSITGKRIEYFDTIREIVNDTGEYYMYIIDELAKKYTKDSKQDTDFYEWLQHSRKHKRITLLIHQEYLLVPNWLRSACFENYTTHKMRFLPFFVTNRGVPYLDDDTKEWCVETTFTYIYKRNKYIANMYDTMETIPIL